VAAVPESALTGFITAIDLVGVFANALLGGAIARSRRMDLVGFAALGIVSGLGGGLLRDTLLQHGTPVALTDYTYLLTALVGAVVAFTVRVEGRVWEKVFPYVDALAVGCWAAVGAQKTLWSGLGWLPAILLGTITAVGGGATRDIVLGYLPRIFGGNTLYATSAIAASGVMVVFFDAGYVAAGAVLATLTGATLCLVAEWRGWQLRRGYAWESSRRRGADDMDDMDDGKDTRDTEDTEDREQP
jgi:uncharacterized membrane protein YeiH